MNHLKRKIHIIGINSFLFEELPKKLQELFIRTNNIAVPDSYLPNIKAWAKKDPKRKKNFFASKSNNQLFDWLRSQEEDAILISRGDPLWFGIGRVLLKNFSKEELCFYPSNTCMQLAFSKLKIPWQETTLVSIHGRDSSNLIKCLKAKDSSIGIITDSKNKSLEMIQNNLLELKLNKLYDFWLCEEIGFQNEKIRKLNLDEAMPSDISDLNIAILIKKEPPKLSYEIPLFGLQDYIFKTYNDRPNLLTKREIRIQILADLELPENGVICDIGAGCGSIGLEALKLRPNLKLFSIDKRIGAKALIMENASRLGVKPKNIFEEDINNLFNSKHYVYLKNANRIIIGGCDKKTKLRIINELSQYMQYGDIFVIPLIDLQSVEIVKKALNDKNFALDINLIQTYKTISIPEGMRLDPNNPVFILKGKKY